MGLEMKYSRALNSGTFFWIVLLLTGAVVLWASVFKLDKSVIVLGQVSPLGKPVPVQSRYEGKIKTIHVKVGDRISVGASLVDFDSEQELSDREEAHLDLIRLDIEQRRLAAQLRLAVDFPRQTNDDLRIWLDQKRVLVSEVSNLKQDLAVLAQEKQVKLGSLASFESKLVALSDALMLFKRKLQLTQALYDKGFTGDIALMEAKKAVSDILREQADVQLSIDNLSNEVDLIEGKAQSRRLDFERQVSGALLEVRQAKELASFRFTAAAARLKSRSLSAPVAGMVSKVATNYVGEVTMAGDTLIEIIPEGQPLVFYVQIEVADIDDVAAGQEASVTLANMNSRVDPDLKGSLVSVDPDATTDKDSGRSFYGAVIALPENDRVLPGMTGTASLKLGERTVIEYFIEPLLYGLRGALSETY
jgi:HlyD family type I secretion membrane fusion protein